MPYRRIDIMGHVSNVFHGLGSIQRRARLQALLDRQDAGQELTPAEREAAEGLVNMAEFLSLVRLGAERTDKSHICPA